MLPSVLLLVVSALFLGSSLFFRENDADVFFDAITAILFLLLAIFAWMNNAQRQSPTPMRLVCMRWVRWGLFALAFASLFYWVAGALSPETSFSFSRLIFAGALVWLVYDGGYTWLIIGAISRSETALSPHFRTDDMPVWPNQPVFFGLKDSLRAGKWQEVGAFRADVAGVEALRVRTFIEPEATVRAHLYLLIQPAGGVTWSVSFESLTDDQQRLLTDNLFLPYGGFYPEDWHVARKPWVRSFDRLLALHKKRMVAAQATWQTLGAESCEEINAQQRALEKVNLEMGFLNEPKWREEAGFITRAGRYRLWKEILKLNYFGRTRAY